jgi:tetratricopeptide (TPR) repeat protein
MVQPNVSENERRDASARGAAHLYADTGVDGTSLEGLLEIHRLALAGAETTVARDVADVIGSALIHQQRYRESARISGATLELGEDYRLLHNLGRAERVLGMATAALAHLERALAACPAPPVDMERSVTRERGAILFNLAELLAVKGEVARAMELYTESGQIDEHLGDTLGKSATLGNMAGLIAQQGDVTRAFELWGESLHLKELVGDVQGKATTLNNIATVIAEQGDVKRALELWNESLRIQELNGDLMGKATTLGNIGNVIARQGDVKRALELWDESLKLKELIGDVQGRSATLNNMAGVIERQGNVKRALELWDESLKLKELTGDVQGKAATLGNMAGAIARQGNIKRALELWTESLELNELIGDVQGKAVTLANMAWVAEQSGDRDRSRQLNLGAVRLLVSVKALPDVVTVLANLGNSEESVPFLAQALWLGRQVHAPARTLVGMASRLTEVLGTTHDAAKLIAASALLSALEKVDSEQDDLRQASFMLLAQVVEARGVAPEALAEWVAAERLTDAAHVASALDEALVALVGDGWLFDRAALDKPAG